MAKNEVVVCLPMVVQPPSCSAALTVYLSHSHWRLVRRGGGYRVGLCARRDVFFKDTYAEPLPAEPGVGAVQAGDTLQLEHKVGALSYRYTPNVPAFRGCLD